MHTYVCCSIDRYRFVCNYGCANFLYLGSNLVEISSYCVDDLFCNLRDNQLKNSSFNGAVRLSADTDNNLYAGTILVGNKFTFMGSLPILKLDRLTVVSRNCSFNTFLPQQIEEWVNYVNKQFIDGVAVVCLQDFPYEYVQQLSKIGHVIHIVYAIGDNGKLISNIIIAHPYIISKEEFKACNVFYLAEKSNLSRGFISGCLLVNFTSQRATVGSLYAHFATTAESRIYELKVRQNWIQSYKTFTFTPALICGNFNPRTLSSITDEAPMVKTKFSLLNNVIYYIRLIPFIIFSLFGETALKELKRNKKFGLVFPDQSTMKDKKVGWLTIPFGKMDAVMDLVQTNLSPDSVDVAVFPGDELGDHYPIRVLIKEGSEYYFD
jgi:hypothetical protein